MATDTTPPAATETVPAQPIETTGPALRRTVTLPVLPVIIVGAVIVAVIFFGGGVALGFGIADHPQRIGNVRHFGGRYGYGTPGGDGRHGFGQNRPNGQNSQKGQNGQQPPNGRPSTAPQNG